MPIMLIRLVTAPTTEPVSLREAKDHLRLDETRDDDRVLSTLKTARRYLESVTWRALVTTVYDVTLPGFSGDDRFELMAQRNYSGISSMIGFEWTNTDRAYRFLPYLELPRGNLDDSSGSPIVSFTYLDPNGAQQTLDPSVYEVDAASVPGRIRLAYNKDWPLALDHWNAVTIRYKVGWPVKSVPEELRQAILIHAAQLYEYRTTEVITRGSPVPVSLSYDALIAPYRLFRV